jgi:methyl-accepting chemotaxis protein
LGQETLAASGVMEVSDTSFIDGISRGMASVTAVLTDCISTDHDMAVTMQRVAATVAEITSFVRDIDEIGFEIVLLALNAQIKAAHAGERGAGLGVLAEAIRQLSDEAVQRTDAVSVTLTEIHGATEHLAMDSNEDEAKLCARIMTMEGELADILRMLGEMNAELFGLLSKLQGMVNDLSVEVERITSQIDIHERSKVMADEVMVVLARIVSQSRDLEPASSDFQEQLRQMEEQYTMESERRIHDAIALKHGVLLASASQVQTGDSASGSDSEFGDNVDLF